MKITYFGHNCFLFDSDIKILSDPFISGNPNASKFDINSIFTDFILLTHGHEDHVADVEKVFGNTGAKLIAMVEVAAWFEKKGINNSHSLNFGGTYKFTENTSAKFVQAIHSSSMPDGSYGGNPGSYIILTEGKTIFLAGDTALHKDLEMYGELYNFDLVILPIGGNFTMDPEEAIYAAKYLQCREVIGCHYDTFPIIEIDKPAAIKHFTANGLILNLLKIGKSFDL